MADDQRHEKKKIEQVQSAATRWCFVRSSNVRTNDLPKAVSKAWYIDNTRQRWPNWDAYFVLGPGVCMNSG